MSGCFPPYQGVEVIYNFTNDSRLRQQLLASRCRFFGRGGIRLRHFIELVHGKRDLADSTGLLSTCRSDLSNKLGSFLGHIANVTETCSDLIGNLNTDVSQIPRPLDLRARILSCISASLGEFPHLFCHDGKPATGISSSRRFDGMSSRCSRSFAISSDRCETSIPTTRSKSASSP